MYLPSEGTDYEFYPTKTEVAHNGGAEPQGNEQTFLWTVPTITGSGTTPAVGGQNKNL